jgi:hypothetical protein
MGGADDLEMGVGRVSSAPSADSTEAATGINPAEPARAPSAVDGVEALSQSLAAGEIDPAQAQRMLIESVVAQQLPEGASAELAEAIRAEVEAMLAEDPTLQALLSP